MNGLAAVRVPPKINTQGCQCRIVHTELLFRKSAKYRGNQYSGVAGQIFAKYGENTLGDNFLQLFF